MTGLDAAQRTRASDQVITDSSTLAALRDAAQLAALIDSCVIAQEQRTHIASMELGCNFQHAHEIHS